MFKLISVILEKMGNWFGVIFKITLPLIVMYRPIKTFAFSIVVVGMYYGGNPESMNTFGLVLFGLLYIVLLALLICFPKVASAVEFLLIGCYLAFLGFLYIAGSYSSFVAVMTPLLWTYINELPIVLVFLAGKIFFFFFIRSNRKSIEEMKREDNQMLYHSEDMSY